MKKFVKNNLWILLIILFVIIITYMFPYTHDDWAWGSSMGINKLVTLFKDYNGRYMGNLLIILISRVRIIKTIIESITLILIGLFIYKIVDNKKKSILPIMIILLLSIPTDILAQGIAWTSGFANYIIPVLISLIYIYFNKSLFNLEMPNIKNRWIIPFILLGIIGTLFIEHVTIYLVILSIFINIIIFIKHKKVSIPNIAFLLGSIIGAVIMFSNGGYYNVINETDNYRSATISLISIIKTYFQGISVYMITDNKVLNIILSSILLYISYKYIENNKKISKLHKILLKINFIFLTVFLSYTIFMAIIPLDNIFVSDYVKLLIEGLSNAIYVLSIIYTSIFLINNKNIRNRIIFYLGSTILVCAPLLVVTPIGPRCFFVSFIFFALITLELINLIIKDNDYLIKIFKIVGILMFIYLLLIYGYSFKVEMARNDYIEENKDKDELVLPKIPNEEYLWNPNPQRESFNKKFKMYYGIDENVEVTFVSYKEWKEKIL